MPTSTASSRVRSTSSPEPGRTAESAPRRCETCGAEIPRLGFQIVMPLRAATYERIDCALAGSRSRPGRFARGDLSTVETLTAELFVARVKLEAERRRNAELESRLAQTEARDQSAPQPA